MTLEDRLSILLSNLLERLHRPLTPMATVLVYHSVRQSGEVLLPDSVTVAEFERQMRYLREQGYVTMSVTDLARCLRRRQVPKRSVAVTFDDGYLDTFQSAFPILQRWQIAATVFLAAGYIGTTEPFPWLRQTAADALPMEWRQARELRAAGVEIGSHTFTHRFLPHLPADELARELAKSKEVIEVELGTAVHSVSLPFSFPLSHPGWPLFEKWLRGALLEAGYLSCCTMQRGHLREGEDLFALKRIAVGRGDDLALFRAKLAGCYSWTQPMQLFYQRHLKTYPATEYGSLC